MDDFIKSLDSLKSQLSNILTSIQEDTKKAFQKDDYTVIAPLTIEYKGIRASLPIDLAEFNQYIEGDLEELINFVENERKH